MVEAALAYMPALTASTMEPRCGRNHGKTIQRRNNGRVEAVVMGNLIAKLEISDRYCTVGKGW
jgi:hypothetical protein